MLVGHSDVVGRRVHDVLDRIADIAITAQVPDGVGAVSALRLQSVDAIVLDIGDTANNVKVTLSRLFKVDPAAKVVMVSSLTFASVKTSMMGLLAGAAEYIPTPGAHTKTTDETEFADKLTSVIRALGRSERTVEARPDPAKARASGKTAKPITLRPAPQIVPEILVIGSSTGGPQALFTFIASLPPQLKVPILITQHMPATFTELLAKHISKHSGRDCREGVDGEAIVANRLYLAPGDWHMVATGAKGSAKIRLHDGPPVNFCRPSVDPLFESISEIYQSRVMAVILTGMGNDGLEGSRKVVDAGGMVIAQDEETSVVWGMPRAVAEAGICSAILPLDGLAPFVGKIFGSR